MKVLKTGVYFCFTRSNHKLSTFAASGRPNVNHYRFQNVRSCSKWATGADTDSSTSSAIYSTIEQEEKSVYAHLATRRQRHHPEPEDSKILKVSIIGAPNAGKSTLINQLVGWKLMPFSGKVHTTRRNALAVWTEENTQIVFIDTPGLIDRSHMHKHNLEESLLTDPEKSLCDVDVIGVVVDAANRWTRNALDKNILKLLHLNSHIPSFLILNKLDLITKRDMLVQNTRTLTEGIVDNTEIAVKTDVGKKRALTMEQLFTKYEQAKDGNSVQDYCEDTADSEKEEFSFVDYSLSKSSEKLNSDELTKDEKIDAKLRRRALHNLVKNKCGWPYFTEVFVISSLNGEGIDTLRQHLLDNANFGKWMYDRRMVTNQDPQDVVVQFVRAKLLDNLHHEIPYELEPVIVLWERDEIGMMSVVIDIITLSNREYFAVLGKGGRRISKMAKDVKQDMMNYFRTDMKLKLQVKLKKKPKK